LAQDVFSAQQSFIVIFVTLMEQLVQIERETGTGLLIFGSFQVLIKIIKPVDPFSLS
jgi:hypothetical protein